MRRARRSRLGKNLYTVVATLLQLAEADDIIIEALCDGNKNKAFGRLLNKWMDSSRESVIDRYIDQDAYTAVWSALNIITKERSF